MDVILVDSSVWISYFKGQTSLEVAYLTDCIEGRQPLTVPGFVLTEVLIGTRSNEESRRFSRTLLAYPSPAELTRSDYEQAADIYRACRARGITIRSTIDCLIAQICLRDRCALLARDRDFEGIETVAPLKRIANRLTVHDEPGIQRPETAHLIR